MIRPLLKSFAAVSCILAFSGCISQTTGSGRDRRATDGGLAQTNLEDCSTSTRAFDPSGAVETYSFIDQLPAGAYFRSSAEVYVEATATVNGRVNGSKVHVSETYTGARDVETAAIGLRCRESVNTFVAQATSNMTLPVRMTRYNDGTFDADSRSFDVNFPSPLDVRASASNGGDDRSLLAATLASQIAAYWNSGTTWVRRSSNVFEVHVRRTESGKRILGKATFTRVDLPANSR
jgi:hypothetical protein